MDLTIPNLLDVSAQSALRILRIIFSGASVCPKPGCALKIKKYFFLHFSRIVWVLLNRNFGGAYALLLTKIFFGRLLRWETGEIGWQRWFLRPSGQKHRFWGVRRKALYNTRLIVSITGSSSSLIAFFKNVKFLGVFGYFWHDQNRGILRIPKRGKYIDSHSRTKKASTFVKVSIESSVFRAFDRDLNEEASYFRLEMAEEILLKKWLRS